MRTAPRNHHSIDDLSALLPTLAHTDDPQRRVNIVSYPRNI
jgi:hypothetical protein